MQRRFAYLIPLFIGLALAGTIAAGLYTEQDRSLQKARLQVFYKLSTIQSGFENALNNRLHLATALKTYVMLNPDIDQETFTSLARGLLSDVTGVRFVELAKDNVITHVFPIQDADRVLGRELAVDFPADIAELTTRAMKTRQRQISAPRSVIEGGKAIVAATPIYLQNPNTNTYWGLVVMLIDAKVLYREAGLADGSPELDIALRKPKKNNSLSRILYGKSTVFSQAPVIMNVPIPDGYWQLAAVPAGGWQPSPARPYIIFGGSVATLLVTALLTAAMFLLLGRLREREKYRYLVQNAKSIILRIDMAGNITFCNEHAEVFYGYEPGELIGKPLIGTLIPKKNLEGESMKRYIHRLLKNPAAHPFNETMNVCKNGEIVWVAWANESVLTNDGNMVELLSVGTDITDRKLMEEALRQRERQYRVLAENVTDVIWGLDADLRFTFVSPSDETLRGFKRYDVLGRPIQDFLTPASAKHLTDGVQNLQIQASEQSTPPSMTLDLEFTCEDGSTVWLEHRLGLLENEEGEIIGWQGVGRDITDRKLAEALRDDVERMARHDLKTPLGAVVGLPGEIRRLGNINQAQEAMLDTIEDAGEAMLHLINRSLDLYKMERGTYILHKKSVDTLKLLDSIKAELRTILREKGVSIGIEAKIDNMGTSFWTTVEEGLFKSLLSNLLLNALQASPEGGFVSVTLERDSDIVITIRNQGEVPPEIRDIFFEKYASNDDSTGSGLGTYSARLIARTHGGDIAVDTDVAGETSVIVTLPQ